MTSTHSSSLLADIFGVPKPLIGMLHAPAFPGRPRYDRDGGMEVVVERLRHDLDVLQSAEVDGLLFCNEMDLPYQLNVGHEVSAGMAAVIGRLKDDIELPFGVDVAWDAHAGIAVGAATEARFVRGVFTGVFDSDMGLLAPSFGDLAGYREQLGAGDMLLFANVTPEFSAPLGHRPLEARVKGAVFLGVDGLIVCGLHTGLPTDLDDVRAAKRVAGDVPVLVSSGITLDTIAETLDAGDAAIVGTCLKVDSRIENPMDPARVQAMVDRIRAIRPR
jgi:membrane complex biogenesis BtpA family protein